MSSDNKEGVPSGNPELLLWGWVVDEAHREAGKDVEENQAASDIVNAPLPPPFPHVDGSPRRAARSTLRVLRQMAHSEFDMSAADLLSTAKADTVPAKSTHSGHTPHATTMREASRRAWVEDLRSLARSRKWGTSPPSKKHTVFGKRTTFSSAAFQDDALQKNAELKVIADSDRQRMRMKSEMVKGLSKELVYLPMVAPKLPDGPDLSALHTPGLRSAWKPFSTAAPFSVFCQALYSVQRQHIPTTTNISKSVDYLLRASSDHKSTLNLITDSLGRIPIRAMTGTNWEITATQVDAHNAMIRSLEFTIRKQLSRKPHTQKEMLEDPLIRGVITSMAPHLDIDAGVKTAIRVHTDHAAASAGD
jgi:hypothetical protein